jgi:hypothetical protein
MPRAVRILIAGTILAAAAHSAATSQSIVLSDQQQSGDIFAGHTLNVVDVSDSSALVSAAGGNDFTGSVVASSAAVTSNQSLTGNVHAEGIMNVDANSGASTVISVAATGNSGESNAALSGAISGTTTQTVGAVNVTALGDYVGPNARTGGLSSSVQAVANSQGYGVQGSQIDVAVSQSSAAVVQADGGGTLQYTDGTALFSALGTANNVTSVGADYSDQRLVVNQSMTGDRTQAAVFAAAGNAQDINAQATATANNLSSTGVGGSHEVNVNQTNSAYLRSQVDLTSFEFGSASANAYGVGNSVMAGNYGPDITLNNTQVNSGGGIEVISSFSGNSGYDAYTSATAVGNAVTGYACSDCSGRMTISNSQRNSTDVSATGVATTTGSHRSVSSVATATGNTGSFYVSQPQ